MSKKTKSIPVNHFGDEGISIEKMTLENLPDLKGQEQSERHDRHSFFLMEKGTVSLEIDFQKYKLNPSSVFYMHPNQVHRILDFKNVIVNCLAINNENLNPEYLKLLEEITPVKPLTLKKETYVTTYEAINFCIKISEQKNNKLYYSLLKDSCNALVALIISQYLAQVKPTDKFSRFEIVAKAFNKLLERDFTTLKSPTAFATKLNISTAYLNECVKHTTGYSVSYHIQQRIILEAKRLLYHSGKSVKEIAGELGYEDAAYFSRMFTKVAGISAITFRKKNHE